MGAKKPRPTASAAFPRVSNHSNTFALAASFIHPAKQARECDSSVPGATPIPLDFNTKLLAALNLHNLAVVDDDLNSPVTDALDCLDNILLELRTERAH